MDTHMKENPKFIQYAIHAAQLAVADARWTHGIDKTRAGVCIASGIGSIDETTKAHDALQVSHRKVSPYFVPRILVNMAAAHVSIKFGLQGPLQAPCTACAAGAHAIGDAYNLIRLNYADTVSVASYP
jgi:3-oxoacyl-[acyl-carrier-protein] synthase II